MRKLIKYINLYRMFKQTMKTIMIIVKMPMKFNFAGFMGYSLEIYGIFIKLWFIVVAFNKP